MTEDRCHGEAISVSHVLLKPETDSTCRYFGIGIEG